MPDPGAAPVSASRGGRVPPWLTERALRLGAGVVLFVFIALHLLNAGLLLFGLGPAGVMRRALSLFWGFAPCAVLLYGAMILHPALALKRLAGRLTWRMPLVEAAQISLGLLIPVWMLRHVAATRGAEAATGIAMSYRELLAAFNSQVGLEQGLLVLIVWVHGCIGVGTALRIRPWFRRWRSLLLALAVFVPCFALAGLISGVREVAAAGVEFAPVPARDEAFARLFSIAMAATGAAFATTAVAIGFRLAWSQAQERVVVRYVDGPLTRGPAGPTLLEISRRNNVPHAAVCGGRARCSTCRIRLLPGGSPQPPPEKPERRLLARIGAPEGVRLACQLRPVGELTVERLVVPGGARAGLAMQQDPFHWGVERRITLMFADIRGFTTVSEKNFAFDIVFALNRFQAGMARAIETNGGRIDKYLGDGLMAIFGADGAEDAGAADALRAARAMLTQLDGLNDEFSALLGERLRIGIGLHSGPAILGRIGGESGSASVTALGDTVNVAARLEELTKTYGVVSVVSETTLELATGLGTQGVAHETQVRGRAEPLKIRAFATRDDLPRLTPN